MKFNSPELQRHVERVYAVVNGMSDDQKLVCGLMDAHYFFGVTEGVDSPKVREALEHLLSSELRPALCDWYRQAGDKINPAAKEFRDRLSEMTGEKFG